MHSIPSVIAVTACLFMLSACASHDSDLRETFETWKANEPDAYVVQTCTLGISPPGCLRAAVEHGVVVLLEERIFGESDFGWTDFTDEAEGAESPLDYMFARVIAGSEKDCRVRDYAYDDAYDYIELYRTTCEGNAGGRQVTCFRTDTLDQDSCDAEPPR